MTEERQLIRYKVRSWWRRNWWPAKIRQLDRERADWKRWCEDAETDSELLESAWGIIANANGGNWDRAENPDWKSAAERWRDKYHETLHVEGT